jgi:hypothetical protein
MNKSSLQQTQAKLRSMYDSSYHLQQCVGDTSKELMQQSFHADTLHDESFSDLGLPWVFLCLQLPATR